MHPTQLGEWRGIRGEAVRCIGPLLELVKLFSQLSEFPFDLLFPPMMTFLRWLQGRPENSWGKTGEVILIGRGSGRKEPIG